METNSVGTEMPRYKSHKEVWALKIKSIVFDSDLAKETNRETDGSATIIPEEAGYAPFKVNHEYCNKHKPQAGGYYVVYEGGYKSWSPADAFEDGYKPSKFESMNFGQAIEALKEGKSVQRKGWNGKGLCLKLQVPDENSKMTLPYVFMSYPSTPASDTAPANHINANVPWLASQTDMLSEDWCIVE